MLPPPRRPTFRHARRNSTPSTLVLAKWPYHPEDGDGDGNVVWVFTTLEDRTEMGQMWGDGTELSFMLTSATTLDSFDTRG